ncbi:hypothetical protein M0811_02763 [Anaeramoeba ignava]|uniref:Uncharacterized protein n=1 Tax=Anaeramoeba ignava TaxID=1746090 RepID=A0A9Q0L8W5_ANAIG|nr:hypothetical protein M0811_02763 [Anaeramoeba ignava]
MEFFKSNLNEWKNVLNKFQDIFKEQGLSNSIQKNLEKKHQLNSTLIFTILKFIKTLLSNTNKNLSSFNLEQDILNFIYLGDEYLLLSLDIIRVFYSQVNFTDSFNYKKLKNQNSKKSWDLIVFESLFHFANPILFNSKSIPFTFLDSFHNEFNQNLKQKKYGKISFGFFVSDQNENQEELLQKMEIDFNEWKGSPVDHLQKLYSQNQEIDKFSEIILTNYFLFQNFQKDPNLFSQIRLKALRTLFSILPRNNIFVEQIKKNEPNLIQQLNDLILTEEKIDYKLRFLALDLLKEIFLHSSFETLIFSKIDFITPKETQSKKQTISEMIQSHSSKTNEIFKENFRISKWEIYLSRKNPWIFSPSTLITENINQKTLKLNKIIINTWYYLSIRNDQFASFLKDQNLPEKLIKIIESHLKLNVQKKQLNLMLFSNRQMMSYINCCFSLLSLFTSKFGNELKEKISKSFVPQIIQNIFKNQELCEKSHNLYIRVSALFL